MKKAFLLGITCAAVGATALVFAVGSSDNATPKMNYAEATTKSMVYSGTANHWSSPWSTYDATTLSSGTLSGSSVVETTVSASNLMTVSSSYYYYEGSLTASTTTATFLFSAGLSGLRSVNAVIESSDGTTISYNTYSSKTDIANPIDQGTMTSGVTTSFAHTTANYIGISFSRSTSGNIYIVTITLTWAC
jgi:hypothetical protein